MIVVAATVGLWIGFAIAAVRAPETTAAWCAKEGPVEHVSAAVLLVIAIAWGVRLSMRRGRHAEPRGHDNRSARTIAVVMLGFVVLVLGEELDWGVGTNVHNLVGGHSYLLFAIVPAAVACVGCVRPHAGGDGPSRDEGIALVIAALPSVASTVALRVWASELDELGELAVYLVLCAWAVRVAARRDNSSPWP